MTDLPLTRSANADTPVGVQGWLLALCLMLTVIGPAIVLALIAVDGAALAARPQASAGQVARLLASSMLMALSCAYGVLAGVRLWRLRPRAVATAKNALLIGLAVDVLTTALAATSLRTWVVDLVPSALFFSLCYAYLQRSGRVAATYGDRDGAA